MSISRIPLSKGTCLKLGGKEYYITDNAPKTGASCIVYNAKVNVDLLNKDRVVLIKELYPIGLDIRRNAAGALVIPKDSAERFEEYKTSFINAAELQLHFHNPPEEADITLSTTNSTSSLENVIESENTLYSVISMDEGQTYEDYDNDDLKSHIEICKNLAVAIDRYHEKGYLHLDIKPENIFVLEGSNQIKLFDFDTVLLKEDINHQKCQLSYTRAFAPPELLLAETDSDYYEKIDERTDIYMIGATLLFKLFDRTPTFMDQLFFQTWDFDKSITTSRTSPQVREGLTYILRKTLSDEQEDRFNNIEELKTALKHILDLLKFDYYLRNNNVYKTSGNDYIPRTQEIEGIRNILNQYHMAYIYGMGGIGKSETARAYAEEYRNDYNVIQLVGYQTDLAETIKALSFSDDEGFKDNNDRYQIVYDRLSDKLLNNEKTLIIIDNYNYISDVAKDISDKEQEVLATNRKVLQDLKKLSIHLVFTTRNNPHPHDIKKGVEIKEFSSDELRELFFRINPRFQDNPERIKKVDKILELTGYHTLTVNLIARQSASIEGMGNHTLDNLIDVISRSGMNNEVDVIVPNNKDEKDNYDVVYNHIKAMFDFSQLNKIEEYVLTTAALLPVTGMEEKNFCKLIALDKVSNQPTGWGLNKTITKLIETGWLRRNGNESVITNMHPIIADVVSNELKPFYTNKNIHLLYNNLKPKNTFELPSIEYVPIIYNIIKKSPINHSNYIALSNLTYHIVFPPNEYERYWEKVENYIMSNNNVDAYDKAWYYAELVERYLIYPLNFSVGSTTTNTWYQEQKAFEHFQINIEKAKDAASLSIKYIDTLPDNLQKARIVLSIAICFLHPYYKDYDTALPYAKLALKYCKSDTFDKNSRWKIISVLKMFDRGCFFRQKASEIETQLYCLSLAFKNGEKNDDSKITDLKMELEKNKTAADSVWDSILTRSQIIEIKEFLSDLYDYEHYMIGLDAIELSEVPPN